MAQAVTGFDISVQNGPAQAIGRASTGIAAFVGRALKGPVNTPVTVRSFADYVHVFGSLWQPSMLGYAVEQFFENGGRTAVVVRVVNGARPPTLALPAGSGELRLTGVAPGSREYLRASVDYDGIGVNEPDRFNLVVQRIRAPGSELVEDQEIFRRLSVLPEADREVADVLTESQLVRVAGPVPAARPDRTPATDASVVVGYVGSNADGDDGDALTDYDLIGSSQRGTGIFALKSASPFDILCLPPHSRSRDVGQAVLLVAARLCREHHALLVVDPPVEWSTAAAAVSGLARWPFRSSQAVMWFPRVLALDRLRGKLETFGSSGAVAGMLARSDEICPVWSAAESDEPALRPGLRTACAVSDAERARLAQYGVNTLGTARTPIRARTSPRTLAAGGSGPAVWSWLAVRRLALFVGASIEQGTRWLVFEPDSPDAWKRAEQQVDAFLGSLEHEGAFIGRNAGDGYFVICDARLNGPDSLADGRVSLLYGFAPLADGRFECYLVTHSPAGSRMRPVTVNRLATSGARVAEEIETAILKGLED